MTYAEEREFEYNFQLAEQIREYWRDQGRRVPNLHCIKSPEKWRWGYAGCGSPLVVIRSDMVNGRPGRIGG